MASEPPIKTGTTRSAGKHVHILGRGMEAMAGAPKPYKEIPLRAPTEHSKEIVRLENRIAQMRKDVERLRRQPEKVIVVKSKENPIQSIGFFPVACECTCGQTFNSRKALKRHRATTNCGNTPGIQTTCPVCGEVFSSKNAWGRHNHESHSFLCADVSGNSSI